MKKIYYTLILLITVLFSSNLHGQVEGQSRYIQFSGKVVTEGPDEKIYPLPFTNVYIKGTTRGTVSESDGFFSLVAAKGDVVVFSQVGFKTVEYIVPDTLERTLYYWIQIMTQDSILLPEAVIRPFPSREHFRIEFLALDISDELQKNYSDVLAEELLREIRYNLPVDGREAINIYMRQTAEAFRYEGQFKPQQIFNPLAWKQFIDAWKRGDFKRKK
ncbi:MAG TPA: carboxypeptidase-like regulatory domain-containing protein [Saprospiraceae bacterium]|nr:carboxypeptidase-like regulatory domain-containing protein [Saprospiraceae bacterium]